MQQNAAIGTVLTGLGAAATGAALVYFLDSQKGGRRRSLVRDKFASAGARLPRAVDATARDLSNRAFGLWSEATHLFSNDNPSDQVIEARVRSKIGRVVSHPSSVNVSSIDGNVTLDGVILRHEVNELLAAVQNVRGVKSVGNRLREFDSSEGISNLQGGRRRESNYDVMQENWSPATRLVAGGAGAAALGLGLARRDAVGIALGAVGAAALARSISNNETKRLFGFGGGRRAVTIEKSININLPVEDVFNVWANFRTFPLFMTNVRDVRVINRGLSHWTVAGPAGTTVEWDAELTRLIPNELIAWKSVEGSPVANAGYVVFEPNDDGSTEVSVHLSYNPPGGALGHAIAKVFGTDPKSEMDQDLMRMKSMLETGQFPHDAAKTIEDVARAKSANQ